jgi:cyclase
MTKLTISRRKWLQVMPLLTASAWANPWENAETMITDTVEHKPVQNSTVFEQVTEIAKNVFFIQGKASFFESGNIKEVACNNGWIIFDDFVLVIDANLPGNAPQLLTHIRKTTAKPIRFVFNTHHHGDHVYGNKYWAVQGATIISYKGLVEELQQYETGYYAHTPGRWEDMAGKRADVKQYPLFPPQLTFDSTFSIADKSKHVELLHLGIGHTRGDGVVWLPKEKILFTGDSCLNGPYNLFRDAQLKSWIDTLEKMKALQAETILPGHGELGDKDTVNRQQHYFKVVYSWVEAKKKQKYAWETIKAELPELRKLVEEDERAKRYLIAAHALFPGFSLEAQSKKIFEEIQSS